MNHDHDRDHEDEAVRMEVEKNGCVMDEEVGKAVKEGIGASERVVSELLHSSAVKDASASRIKKALTSLLHLLHSISTEQPNSANLLSHFR